MDKIVRFSKQTYDLFGSMFTEDKCLFFKKYDNNQSVYVFCNAGEPNIRCCECESYINKRMISVFPTRREPNLSRPLFPRIAGGKFISLDWCSGFSSYKKEVNNNGQASLRR